MTISPADADIDFDNWRLVHEIADAIGRRRPELAKRLVVNDNLHYVRLPLRDGRGVMCARMTADHLTRWTVVTPDRPLEIRRDTTRETLVSWALEEYDRLDARVSSP